MKLIQICKDATITTIECKLNTQNVCKKLTDISKSQGNNAIKLLYTWSHDNYQIMCYGWYDGEAGFENKHDLPVSGNSQFLETDSSEQLLFGDLFILKQIEKKFYDFDISEYGEFYNYSYGGFIDCESDDDSVNTESIDEDYNPDDDTKDEDEYEIDDEDNILEEDTNEY
tara:strand:+ start:6040 stop:6549 length:510 start_codon:yes stop_codon:yes gene_type:complete